MMKQIFSLRFLIVISFLCSSCAQIVNPDGGPKDTKPPRVLTYNPDSAAINFKGNQFSITFDEYIQLKEVGSQLVVSPPLKKQPELKVKKKTLEVTLEDTLRENTTYTFNFGTSIQDITENNYNDGFRYIFSTGPFLDSISLSGKVDYAFDHKTEAGILVMLYDDMSDSVPYKKIPSYFAKTKKDGTYSINNIHAGSYKIFALKDINSNYLYDSDEELIAFQSAAVDLQKNDTVNLSLFREVPQNLLLRKTAVAGYGHLLFIFNKPVEKINIQALNTVYKKQWYLDEYSKQRDTLHLWIYDAGDPDTMNIVLSENDKVIDTVFFNLLKKEDALNPKRSRSGKLGLIATANASVAQPFDLNKNIFIEFNHPIKTFSAIEFSEPDTNKNPDCTLRIMDEIPYKRRYELSCLKVQTPPTNGMPKLNVVQFPEKTKHNYYMPKGVITDIFDLTNDTIKIEFITQQQKHYGNLKLKLSVPQLNHQLILQLMDEKENLITEKIINTEKVFDYSYISPGKYKFKIIYDANNNGKWDTGNYKKNVQPESVIYSKEEITIRSNWDQEVEWKVE